MSKMKVKKKNTARSEAQSKLYTFAEVKAITRRVEESAITKMADACFFTYSVFLIALQDEFGFGAKRLSRIIGRFNGYCRDYADSKFDYKDPIEIGNDLEDACKKLVEDIMRAHA